MKITKSKLRKIIIEALTPRERAKLKLAQLRAKRDKRNAEIRAYDEFEPEADVLRQQLGMQSSIKVNYQIKKNDGSIDVLPSNPIEFKNSKKTLKDLLTLVGATYLPGQERSGIVFKSRTDALKYYSEMTKMSRAQSVARGYSAIRNATDDSVFENINLNREELKRLIREELKRLSYVSKEQGHTYGIEHLPDQYDQKKADDIIGHT